MDLIVTKHLLEDVCPSTGFWNFTRYVSGYFQTFSIFNDKLCNDDGVYISFLFTHCYLIVELTFLYLCTMLDYFYRHVYFFRNNN